MYSQARMQLDFRTAWSSSKVCFAPDAKDWIYLASWMAGLPGIRSQKWRALLSKVGMLSGGSGRLEISSSGLIVMVMCAVACSQ